MRRVPHRFTIDFMKKKVPLVTGPFTEEDLRLEELIDDYEADLQDRLHDHAEMLEAQERERVYQLRMDLWDQLS